MAAASELYTSRRYNERVNDIIVTCVFVGAKDDTFPAIGADLSSYTVFTGEFTGFTVPTVIDKQGDPSTTKATADRHRVVVTGRGLRTWV